MKKLGYLRISKADQCPDRQIDSLRAICDRLFIESYSAKTIERPLFQKVLGLLSAGDSLVVLSVDRAFRSTVDAITQAEQLRERGVHFEILNLAVDTRTADGMLAYTIVAAVAQHERMRISERTKQGLAAARRRGAKLGRPRKLSKQQVLAAKRRIEKHGASISEIASLNEVHPWTLARSLRRLDLERGRE